MDVCLVLKPSQILPQNSWECADVWQQIHCRLHCTSFVWDCVSVCASLCYWAPCNCAWACGASAGRFSCWLLIFFGRWSWRFTLDPAGVCVWANALLLRSSFPNPNQDVPGEHKPNTLEASFFFFSELLSLFPSSHYLSHSLSLFSAADKAHYEVCVCVRVCSGLVELILTQLQAETHLLYENQKHRVVV